MREIKAVEGLNEVVECSFLLRVVVSILAWLLVTLGLSFHGSGIHLVLDRSISVCNVQEFRPGARH